MERIDLDPKEWIKHPVLARETHARLSNEGILLASLDASGKLNPMTIGWGVFGWIWGRPIFTVLVRPSRYTFDCLEATGDFTVNVPPAGRESLADHCGSTSGRTHDKMVELGLSSLPSKHVASPGIAECPIVFECKVVHRNDLLAPEIPADIKSEFYPQDDLHRLYFGEILLVSVERGLLDSQK